MTTLRERFAAAVPDGTRPTSFVSMWVGREFLDDSMLDATGLLRAQIADRLPDPWVFVAVEVHDLDPVSDAFAVGDLPSDADAVLVCGVTYEPDHV